MIKHCLGNSQINSIPAWSKEFSYTTFFLQNKRKSLRVQPERADIKQLLDEVEHDIVN